MDTSRPSFGSGSPLVGGSFVANQMQNAAPGLPMQGPSNPAFTPGTQAAPLPGSLPNSAGAMPIMPPQAAPQPQAQQQPPKSEKVLILEALAKHLGSLAKMDEFKHEMAGHVLGMPPK